MVNAGVTEDVTNLRSLRMLRSEPGVAADSFFLSVRCVGVTTR